MEIFFYRPVLRLYSKPQLKHSILPVDHLFDHLFTYFVAELCVHELTLFVIQKCLSSIIG